LSADHTLSVTSPRSSKPVVLTAAFVDVVVVSSPSSLPGVPPHAAAATASPAASAASMALRTIFLLVG
jgi:hypothetical protein